MKSSSSHSWVWYVHGLLKRYGLPSSFSLLEYPPTKEQWKRMVKCAILTKWENDLKDQASAMSTLSILNLNVCNLSHVHPVWRLGAADSLTVLKATTKAKLLVQRYPLHYSRTSGMNYGLPCPLCKFNTETLEHFLVDCPVLDSTRAVHTSRIQHVFDSAGLRLPCDMVRLVLDPSHYTTDPLLGLMERVTRDMCFDLHQKRSILLGYSTFRHSVKDSLLRQSTANQ